VLAADTPLLCVYTEEYVPTAELAHTRGVWLTRGLWLAHGVYGSQTWRMWLTHMA
jgi:hypothetical protein